MVLSNEQNFFYFGTRKSYSNENQTFNNSTIKNNTKISLNERKFSAIGYCIGKRLKINTKRGWLQFTLEILPTHSVKSKIRRIVTQRNITLVLFTNQPT